jgi:hypothetical protein
MAVAAVSMSCEVALGQPGEPLVVHLQIRQCRGWRALHQQSADRFALVEAEAGDVDQAGDIRPGRLKSGPLSYQSESSGVSRLNALPTSEPT